MVGRGGAPAKREFGQTNPRRREHGFLVDASPQRIQLFEPTKQRSLGHRRIRASEVLVQVMVGVDETRRDQAISCVNDPIGLRARV